MLYDTLNMARNSKPSPNNIATSALHTLSLILIKVKWRDHKEEEFTWKSCWLHCLFWLTLRSLGAQTTAQLRHTDPCSPNWNERHAIPLCICCMSIHIILSFLLPYSCFLSLHKVDAPLQCHQQFEKHCKNYPPPLCECNVLHYSCPATVISTPAMHVMACKKMYSLMLLGPHNTGIKNSSVCNLHLCYCNIKNARVWVGLHWYRYGIVQTLHQHVGGGMRAAVMRSQRIM